jgi:hypothetical protein
MTGWDYRSVPHQCHYGANVYGAISGSRVGENSREKRRLDCEWRSSDESRNGVFLFQRLSSKRRNRSSFRRESVPSPCIQPVLRWCDLIDIDIYFADSSLARIVPSLLLTLSRLTHRENLDRILSARHGATFYWSVMSR